MEAAETEGSTT